MSPAFVSGLPGTDAVVYAMAAWDPDGPGPEPEALVIGGQFREAGTQLADRLVLWRPATRTWHTIGGVPGGSGEVLCFLAASTGELLVGGNFSSIGGIAVNNIARWNGASWSTYGSGLGSFNDRVYALAEDLSGNVLAAGSFVTAGGVTANRVARWNGAAWAPMGLGMDSDARAIAVRPNGDVVVGGQFTTADGVSASRIASWNGTAWAAMGAGTNGTVNALVNRAGGEVVVGGSFTTANGLPASNIARWNGTAWSTLGAGCNSIVRSLTLDTNGDVLAAGDFSAAGGVTTNGVARWNGSAWQAIGAGVNAVAHTITALSGGLLATGGTFTSSAGRTALQAAVWDGVQWDRLEPGFDGTVRASVTLPNGDIVCGGEFRAAGSAVADRIARWDGQAWHPLGSGVTSSSSFVLVQALARMPNGDLVAGGNFTAAGGVPASRVARWNGSSWSALGSGLGGAVAGVNALLALPNGDLIVGGEFTTAGGVSANRVARWNGSAWTAMGTGFNATVYGLARLPNGDIVACGIFNTASGQPASRIASWNGSVWSPLGAGITGDRGFFSPGYVTALLVAGNGDLYAGGVFTTAGTVAASSIARWNGAAWSALGPGITFGSQPGEVLSIRELPSGDLMVGGAFLTPGVADTNCIARWNGTTWSAVVPVTTLGSGLQGTVWSLEVRADGDVLAFGDFHRFYGVLSAYAARLHPGCPAVVDTYGQGCSGGGGPNTLSAVSAPWTGGVYRSRVDGLPPLGVAASILGFTSISIPLASVIAPSPAACRLLTTPDLLDFFVVAAPAADLAVAIPRDPALLGVTGYQQVGVLEASAQGTLVAATSTNGLMFTIGTY